MMETRPPYFMIIEVRTHHGIVSELVRGAIAILENSGASYERVEVASLFEVPAALRFAVKGHEFFSARRRFEGYIALGCAIKAERSFHEEQLFSACLKGMQQVVLEHSLAFGNGVFFADTTEQAQALARDDGLSNLGGEAAKTCLEMLGMKHKFGMKPR